jgi:phospholipid N-methyltransferase
MTGIRRVRTVISRTLTVVIGAAIPASATVADAMNRSVTPNADREYLNDKLTLSVITLTSYGRTAVPAC